MFDSASPSGWKVIFEVRSYFGGIKIKAALKLCTNYLCINSLYEKTGLKLMTFNWVVRMLLFLADCQKSLSLRLIFHDSGSGSIENYLSRFRIKMLLLLLVVVIIIGYYLLLFGFWMGIRFMTTRVLIKWCYTLLLFLYSCLILIRV